MVPVVVFLHGAPERRTRRLGSERHTYLQFTYIACGLPALPYRLYRDSGNIVARSSLGVNRLVSL